MRIRSGSLGLTSALCAALSVGCGGAANEPVSGRSSSAGSTPARPAPLPKPKPKLEGRVQIPHGTRLHVEPSASAWGFELELATLNGPAPSAWFEVTGERNGWVELENFSTRADDDAQAKPAPRPDPTIDAAGATASNDATRACPPTIEGLDAFSLRFFVRSEAIQLEQIDTSPLATRFACTSQDTRPQARDHYGVDWDETPQVPRLQHGERLAHEHDKEFELAAGTQLYWPDGNLAGRSTVTHRYLKAPTSRGERSCVEVKIGAAESPQVSLCANPRAIVEVPYERPRPSANEIAEAAGILALLAEDQGNMGAIFGSGLDDEALNDALFGAGGMGVIGGGLDDGAAFDHPTGLGASRSQPMGSVGGLGGLGTVGALGADGEAPEPRPHIRISQVRGGGTLSASDAKRSLVRSKQQFRYCYELGFKRDPSLTKVSVSIDATFNDDGRCKDPQVYGAATESMTSCMRRSASRMRARGPGTLHGELEFVQP